jgi:predicted NBD/HSP70 family sugar kinase
MMAGDEAHNVWSSLLVDMEKDAASKAGGGVSSVLLAKVLKRVRVGAGTSGAGVLRTAVVAGSMLKRPSGLAPASVSKATSVLLGKGLLSEVNHNGQKQKPLQLGRDRFVIGIHVAHEDGKLSGLYGVLTRLNGEQVTPEPLSWQPLDVQNGEDVGEVLVNGIKLLATRLMDSNEATATGATQLKLLGVGVEIGAHVYEGKIILATNARALDGFLLRDHLTRELKCPVILENDVVARAIHAYYENRLDDLDFTLVEVFDGGVGGAHIIDGRIYRGSHGLAPEIGHISVEYRPTTTSSLSELDHDGGKLDHDEGKHPTFSDRCTCGSPNGHVDTFATTCRIRGELGVKTLAELAAEAESPGLIEEPDVIRLSPAATVFREAGTGLGRGLEAMINIVNPGELMLRLPRVLAAAKPQTSGAQYLSAVENAINEAFSTGANDARNGKQRLSVEAVDDNQVAHEGALAATTTVLNAFLDHARERNGCKLEPKSRD